MKFIQIFMQMLYGFLHQRDEARFSTFSSQNNVFFI